MIFKESKGFILQNLGTVATIVKGSSETRSNLFLNSELSIDQRKLQNDFIANFKTVSGEVYLLEKKEDLIKKINELIRTLDAKSVSFWNINPMKSLKITSEIDIASADIGITGADFAIADTGTLVLLSSPKQPRLTSLLPPVHIAILKKENIVLNIYALFAKLGETYEKNDELSTCISFITGPSRTADIELNLTLGVHGPEKAIVIII